MPIVNMMEKFVDEKLRVMLEDCDCCKCEHCFDDMKAIALNSLPPRYVSSFNGELFTKIDSMLYQNAVDINVSVATAIQKAAKNPHHNIK